ncbi:MAG TPA: HAD-IA family hydrolase [Candidatus Saccharimonadales bacterium]|nr:HAD-IA family hydrolase [Candidatus Saccharimonadales bacterium]
MIKVVLFDYFRVVYGPLPHPTIRKLAKRLREHGIRTGILSNTILGMPLAIRLTGGYRGFAPVILSSKVGIAKPNSGIYDIAIKRTGAKPREILFIDNRAENIEAARKLGLHVIRAKNAKQVNKEVGKVLAAENNLKL